jgi:hypothetical protein
MTKAGAGALAAVVALCSMAATNAPALQLAAGLMQNREALSRLLLSMVHGAGQLVVYEPPWGSVPLHEASGSVPLHEDPLFGPEPPPGMTPAAPAPAAQLQGQATGPAPQQLAQDFLVQVLSEQGNLALAHSVAAATVADLRAAALSVLLVVCGCVCVCCCSCASAWPLLLCMWW